jgi:uncharacterized protein YndB with AHSA1/START domain
MQLNNIVMDIAHKLKIKATADKIYDAVATEKGIHGWWAKKGKVGEVVGDESLLKFDKQGKIVEMTFKTEKLVPNKEVVWECVENANPAWIGTKIITSIEEGEDGCNVIFSHANFDDKWQGDDAFEMTKQTWEHFVKSLVDYSEKGQGQPW